MRMRIAMVLHQFLPDHVGGVEVYAWTLGKALMAMGHQVHLFVPRADRERLESESLDGLTVWSAPGPSRTEGPLGAFFHAFRNLRTERAYRRFLDQVHPDVVHVQHLQRVSTRVMRLSQPLPTVVSLHDYWYRCPNSQLLLPDGALCSDSRGGWRCGHCGLHRAGLPSADRLGWLAAPLFAHRQRVVWRALRLADAYHAPSDFVRQWYLSAGLPAERVYIVPHGLDASRLAGAGKSGRTGAGVGLRLGYLGSIAPAKGLHVLIEAFNSLPADASLTIFGDLEVAPDYVAELRRLARHPGVRFAGGVSPQRVGRSLAEMDCMVVPSLWHETFCLVIQEANAVGVPVVASDLGALPERVQDGVNGRLFPPGDVEALSDILQELARSPETLVRWRENLTPPLTIQEHTERIEGIYRGAIAARCR